MSESADDANYLEDVKGLERSVVASKLNIILSRHQDKDVKNIRKPLEVLLAGVDMDEVVERLKKFSRESAHQASFLLKEHYDEITVENGLLFDREENTRKEKLDLEISLRKDIKELSTTIDDLSNQLMKAKGSRREPLAPTIPFDGGLKPFEATTKRSTKIPDPPLFSDGKTMPVSQWVSRMKNKLFANADHFETEEIKMIYVESRTEGNAAKHLDPRMREDSPCPFRSSGEMLETLREIFDDPNRKLTAINEFRSLRMGDKDFHSFWGEFQRIAFNLTYDDETLMTEMIHKLHPTLQRLVVVGPPAKSVYDLAKQCQRIYEGGLQADKTERIANRIDMQKQRRTRTFGAFASSSTALAPAAIAPAPFPRQPLSESKPRLFNPSPDAAPRLTQKELQILSKQGRCFKCKELGHRTPACEGELKPMPAELKEIVELSDSEN